ncbi:MAG TPA: DUF1236 domain-containing protein [Bradyrhizobium sp.]|nr:DUF1236 domain-containing protein [Bradyrhizobium sp.]
MKTKLVTTAAALALASGVASAPAAATGTISKFLQPSAMHAMTKPPLALTRTERKLALKDIGRSGKTQSEPARFTPTVGATVPTTLALRPVPANLGRQVSALKTYDYALLRHDLLIVNPTNKRVVDVINRHA